MKILLSFALALLVSQNCHAQTTYTVKKKYTKADSAIVKKEVYSAGSTTKISGSLIPLSFKSKDTIYLSKTPLFAEDTFVLMLKTATPIYSYQIIVHESANNMTLLPTTCNNDYMASVNSLLDMIRRGNRVHGLLYDFMYINSAGRSVKMDKNIIILP